MTTARIGSSMYIAAIVAFIALMAWLFSDQLADRRNPNRDIDSRTAPAGAPEIVLQRNRYGHYVASGAINGVDTELMLDTGATDVAVSADVARRAGLEQGSAITVATANGPARAWRTRIGELRLGSIVEHDLPATIVPRLGDIDVLLGMSFLRRLDFSQRGDRLILTSRRAVTPLPQ